MYGIVFATVLVVGWGIVLNDYSLSANVLLAAQFLWVWSLFCWVVESVGVFLVGLHNAAILPTAPPEKESPQGVAAYTLAILWAAMVATVPMSVRLLFPAGAYLLLTAGTVDMDFADFNTNQILLGSVLWGTGMFILRNHRTIEFVSDTEPQPPYARTAWYDNLVN